MQIEIEKVYLNNRGNIVVEAIVPDMVETRKQTHLDPPEYGPCLCETEIDKDCIPDDIVINDDPLQLETIINQYNLLLNQEWFPIDDDSSDKDFDDYTPSGANLYY